MLRTSLNVLVFIALTAATLAAETILLPFKSWSGQRTYLAEHGIDIEAALTVDSLLNTRGGVRQDSAVLGNLDLSVEADTELLGFHRGGRLFIYGLGNFGDEMTEIVGDIQGTSNIEAFNTAKVYEAWYEHRFLPGISLLGGLHDYNSEFAVVESGGHLLNSSFGISPEIAQVGPSIFPTTSLGLRARYEPSHQAYFLAGLYDGVPGDPNDFSGTSIRFGSDDGLFYALEIGVEESENAEPYKLSVGGWYLTAKSEDVTSSIGKQNWGLYSIAEAEIHQQFAVFFQLGMADDKNILEHYQGVGLIFTGVIEARPSDTLSIAVAVANASSAYRKAFISEQQEVVFECAYTAVVSDRFFLTPDVQYIVNPGLDPDLKNALQVGLRTVLSF